MPEANNNYISCANCRGSGRGKMGMSCPACAGMGLGAFFHRRFFFWGPKLSRGMIELEHLRKKIYLAVNIISFVIGLAGLLAMAYWVYDISQYSAEAGAFYFWREKSSLILFFWISLVADMFVFYRINEESRRTHRIKPMKYLPRDKQVAIPNNWEELKKWRSRYKVDVAGGFSQGATETVERAFLLADTLNHGHVTPIHIFFSILSDQDVAALFARLNVSGKDLVAKIKEQLEAPEIQDKGTVLSRTAREIFVSAYLEAYGLGQNRVTPKNLIIGCMDRNRFIRDLLYDMEVDRHKVFNVILWFIVNEKLIQGHRLYQKMARFKPGTNMDRAYTSVATPALNQMGYDLTIAAKWGRLEYCVARDEEIERIFQAFEGGGSGVLLVGNTGVGKNSIVDGIAQKMVREDVPGMFRDKRLVELDAARLISGAGPSQAEGRLVRVLDEVSRAGNIILFMDNIENIIGISSGEEQSMDLSEVLASAMDRKNVCLLATATSENYAKYIEGSSLGNAMIRVLVKEPEGNQAIQIIESKIGAIEARHQVYFSYNAIEEVINMTVRYIHDKYLPDKAISLLETVAVRVAKKKGAQSMVTRDDIAEVVSDLTNIPVTRITESEGRSLLNLEDRIHERMIDQEEAVKMVASSLRRARTQLREGKRPIASFLFLGPTGVGKTELAKTVAHFYFGNEKAMVRLDMSEYQNQDSLNKMIGDSAGNKGYLTEAVRNAPFSLLLLDEFEKAHPDILNLFLQVMDDGRLTDGTGRTIDFTNTIIIATSNAGALYIQEQVLAGTDIDIIEKNLINDHLNQIMRPELINRFDGLIVFKPLSLENVVDIAKLMIHKTAGMLEGKGMYMRVSEEAVRKLAEEGFDPKFGARPLRRVIQENVEDGIANKVLSGELKRRDTVVIEEDLNIVVEKAKKI